MLFLIFNTDTKKNRYIQFISYFHLHCFLYKQISLKKREVKIHNNFIIICGNGNLRKLLRFDIFVKSISFFFLWKTRTPGLRTIATSKELNGKSICS